MRLKRNPPKGAKVRTSLAQWHVPTIDWCGHNVARVAIDTLPHAALLNIFYFYLEDEYVNPMEQIDKPPREVWRTLAHVCRKWRNIVFGSPHRLDLRVYCRASTPVTKMLDIWPNLPIVVWVYDDLGDLDNTIAALEHANRVCAIYLWHLQKYHLEDILATMQQPFPALTHLVLGFTWFTGDIAPLDPDLFLGGSAPGLQLFMLDHIPFPGLPKLLLSATHLVDLHLRRIPHSGYISPDAMVAGLSALTRLENLVIEFESPRSRPARSHRSPRTRALLPVLNYLLFKGVSEYLEDLLAGIHAPLLNVLQITFFHKLIFDTPQLTQLISHTPNFKVLNEAHVTFYDSIVSITTSGFLGLNILSKRPDWQLLSLARFCGSSFPLALIPVERLYIKALRSSPPPWQDESSQWLELLHLFTGVKDLYISSQFTPRIASALQEPVSERVTKVLPSLRALFFSETPSGSVPEAFGKFVAARQLAGHPISVSRWHEGR